MLDKELPDHIKTGDIVEEIFPGIERIMKLFPDGPPDQAMVDLYNPATRMLEVLGKIGDFDALDATGHIANAASTLGAASEWSGGDTWADIKKIDNDRQYYVTMPTGTEIRADRRSRNHWSLTVISPPSPSGKRIRMTRNVPGEKSDIYIAIGEVAEDILKIRRALAQMVVKSESFDTLPEEAKSLVAMLLSPTELPFDGMYDAFNSNAGDAPEFRFLVKVNLNTTGRDLMVLTGIAIHEIWRHLADNRYEEDKEMAKNSGGMVWWEITGGRTSLNKIINSLTHNRHMVVQDTQERIFLKIQNSEQRFVDQMTSRHNCRAKLVDEPEYGETLCGKFHRQPELHSHRCNACNRVKDNNERAEKAQAEKEQLTMENEAQSSEQSTETKVAEAAAIQRNKEAIKREPVYPSTTSPDGVFTSGLGSTLPANPIIPPPFTSEQREWEAKNGPVITIQGPQPRQSNDIEGLAQEYRRVSDELVERASYYATLAEKYEALLLPTDAVKEAEAALEAAKAKDREDREAQIKALQDMLAAGPPA